MGKETLEIIETLSESVQRLKEEVIKEKQFTNGDCVRRYSNYDMAWFFQNLFSKGATVEKMEEWLNKPFEPNR